MRAQRLADFRLGDFARWSWPRGSGRGGDGRQTTLQHQWHEKQTGDGYPSPVAHTRSSAHGHLMTPSSAGAAALPPTATWHDLVPAEMLAFWTVTSYPAASPELAVAALPLENVKL